MEEVTAKETGSVRELRPRRTIEGTLTLPGDKSISHRAALISAFCSSPLYITNYSDGEDCRRSLDAAVALGVTVEEEERSGKLTLTPPKELPEDIGVVDCGNSGTTARLLAGLLVGAGVTAELHGDASLSQRPMMRIIEPLNEMGADIESNSGTLPLKICGRATGSLDYNMPVPSAQVKSSLLLAALGGGGRVIVTEDTVTRDHTERMLSALGAPVERLQPRIELREDPHDFRKKVRTVIDDWKARVILKGGTPLRGGHIEIPGDISTAAFFFAAAAIGKGNVTIQNLGLNPTRTAFLDYLKLIGCEVIVEDKTEVSGEPRGTVTVRGGELRGRKIQGDTTAALIDEIPIISALACFCSGPTIIRDAQELRVKESDRIEAMAVNLRRMGAKVGTLEDGMAIEVSSELEPADFDSFNDHRVAMALSVAALFLPGVSSLRGDECVAVSCPRFYQLLEEITS